MPRELHPTRHRSLTRDTRIVASVPCPVCGAGLGRKCDALPREAPLNRPHDERRALWLAWKREHGL